MFDKSHQNKNRYFSNWDRLNVRLCPIEVTLKTCQQYLNDQQKHISICHPLRVLGENLLNDGQLDRFSFIFITCPELLTCLLFVEILDFNEVLIVENVDSISRIVNFQSAIPDIELFEEPKEVRTFLIFLKKYVQNLIFLIRLTFVSWSQIMTLMTTKIY